MAVMQVGVLDSELGALHAKNFRRHSLHHFNADHRQSENSIDQSINTAGSQAAGQSISWSVEHATNPPIGQPPSLFVTDHNGSSIRTQQKGGLRNQTPGTAGMWLLSLAGA